MSLLPRYSLTNPGYPKYDMTPFSCTWSVKAESGYLNLEIQKVEFDCKIDNVLVIADGTLFNVCTMKQPFQIKSPWTSYLFAQNGSQSGDFGVRVQDHSRAHLSPIQGFPGLSRGPGRPLGGHRSPMSPPEGSRSFCGHQKWQK